MTVDFSTYKTVKPEPLKGLRSRRLAAKMTQADVARILEMTPNHYARIERGEADINLSKAFILAKLFDCVMDALL